MNSLTLNASVGDWVTQKPGTARIFESFGVDYCCGGKKTLQQACQEQQLDAGQVLEQLLAVQPGGGEVRNWGEAPLAELCDHIEQTHHVFLKTELPRLTAIIAKVAQVHGAGHPELASLPAVFADLRADLEPHMFKEEQILFPAIRSLESQTDAPQFPMGQLAHPVRVMEQEHDYAGECLTKIRRLTDDYRVPADACNTYRVMLESLRELEADMHRHVHKENNILFPRALEAEGRAIVR